MLASFKGKHVRLGAVLLPGISQIGDDGIHQRLHLVRGDVAPVRAPRGAGRFPFLIRLHFPQGDFGTPWGFSSRDPAV